MLGEKILVTVRTRADLEKSLQAEYVPCKLVLFCFFETESHSVTQSDMGGSEWGHWALSLSLRQVPANPQTYDNLETKAKDQETQT